MVAPRDNFFSFSMLDNPNPFAALMDPTNPQNPFPRPVFPGWVPSAVVPVGPNGETVGGQ